MPSLELLETAVEMDTGFYSFTRKPEERRGLRLMGERSNSQAPEQMQAKPRVETTPVNPNKSHHAH